MLNFKSFYKNNQRIDFSLLYLQSNKLSQTSIVSLRYLTVDIDIYLKVRKKGIDICDTMSDLKNMKNH